MTTTGAVYGPDLIAVMKSVLDDAAAALPAAERTSAMKAELAARILACAAHGERDRDALIVCALPTGPVHYSHDISPARRAV